MFLAPYLLDHAKEHLDRKDFISFAIKNYNEENFKWWQFGKKIKLKEVEKLLCL